MTISKIKRVAKKIQKDYLHSQRHNKKCIRTKHRKLRRG